LEKQAGLKLPINRRLIKGVLFCLVYIHIYEEQRIKHGDRSVPCVYMGFDSTNNQFIAMEWLTGKNSLLWRWNIHAHDISFPFEPPQGP
jgi:hypothetical protein